MRFRLRAFGFRSFGTWRRKGDGGWGFLGKVSVCVWFERSGSIGGEKLSGELGL